MPEAGRFQIYNDAELMQLICSGETGAFDELYLRYAKRLMVYFTHMLGNKKPAEDALQEIFLKIAESPERFNNEKNFKTWVFSVANNYCKNYYRRTQMMENKQQEIEWELTGNSYESIESISKGIDRKNFMEALQNVLLSISPEKRETFILRYQEDKSLEEISGIQKCSVGTVKSRLHYTLKILEEKLKLFNPVN